jgi:glycine/D-amino acid oxidase-like deaminating enzyme
MELVSGYPFWLIKDGLPYQYPKLAGNSRCDCVIIGGGISGALTAYHLVNAGFDCILLDGRTIGLGSTCASTSLLQYELDIPLHKLIKKVGYQKAVRSYQVCGEAIEKLSIVMNDIGFHEHEQTGSLYFSTHHRQNAFMKKEWLARKEAGFDISLLTEKEIKQRYGLKAVSGIRSEKGITHNAYALTHALLQHSLKKGLQVYDRSYVERIRYRKKNVIVTTKEACSVTASYLINATGYEVVNFISKGIVSFHRTYAIASEHQPEKTDFWEKRSMLWNTDDPYLYMALTADNRIMVGGRDEPFSDKTTREKLLKKKAAALEKDFRKLIPGIDLKKEFYWSGTFGKTKDSLPYIGAIPENPHTFYALGFGGNGITFSLVAAEIITDLLRGKKNEDAKIFGFNR